tara:strand:- start:10243 stop:10392 length:150 start_codon:yes stop_codon:yes gene_type:complete
MKYEFLKPSQKKKIMDGLKNDLTIKQISEKLEISVGVINEMLEKKFTRK